MAKFQIKWSSLLNLSELEFVPEQPKTFMISDELVHSIAWLTAATKHNRMLLRCNDSGELIVTDPWNVLGVADYGELYIASGSDDSDHSSADNKGVLVSTGAHLGRYGFVRINGGSTEYIYIPADTLFWFGHKCYSITGRVVPAPGGEDIYTGLTWFV